MGLHLPWQHQGDRLHRGHRGYSLHAARDPGVLETGFNSKVIQEAQTAINAIKERHDLDITETTRVNAAEFAHGGYVKVQKPRGKAVNER